MAITKVTDSLTNFDTLTVSGTQAADTTYLKLENKPASAATNKVEMEFWGNEGTADASSFNMARIYGEFDGSSYATTRLTLGSASGGGTFNDELSLKNGNVGIGTTSPTVPLQINHGSSSVGLYTLGSYNYQAKFESSDSEAAIVIEDSNSTNDGNRIGVITDSMTFITAGSERIRINSSGSVGMNTTSPAAPLHVKGASGAVTGVIYANQDTTGLGKPGIALAKFDNNTTTSQVFMMFGVDQYNAGCGQINANGASQAAFGSFSDRRLKENITDLPSQLDNIVALEPKEFDYIESEGGGHQIGFIAQDVEEIYPDLVGERDSDNMKTLTGIGKMEARLISAIKELKTELDAAKARIETLENA